MKHPWHHPGACVCSSVETKTHRDDWNYNISICSIDAHSCSLEKITMKKKEIWALDWRSCKTDFVDYLSFAKHERCSHKGQKRVNQNGEKRLSGELGINKLFIPISCIETDIKRGGCSHRGGLSWNGSDGRCCSSVIQASAAFCCYWQGHKFYFMNEHSKALLYLPLLPASTQKKLHTAKCDNLQQLAAHIHPASTVGLSGLNNFVWRLWHLAGIKEQRNNVSTWEISSADIVCLRCYTDQSQLCITVPHFFSQV